MTDILLPAVTQRYALHFSDNCKQRDYRMVLDIASSPPESSGRYRGPTIMKVTLEPADDKGPLPPEETLYILNSYFSLERKDNPLTAYEAAPSSLDQSLDNPLRFTYLLPPHYSPANIVEAMARHLGATPEKLPHPAAGQSPLSTPSGAATIKRMTPGPASEPAIKS